MIVDNTANIDRACNQILSGRTANAGQMCIAPDYVLCHEDVIDELAVKLTRKARQWFGNNDEDKNEYVGHIVNERMYEKVTQMIKDTRGVFNPFV